MLGDLVQETVALRGDDLEIMRPRDAEALVDERAFAEEDEFLPYWAELWPAGGGLERGEWGGGGWGGGRRAGGRGARGCCCVGGWGGFAFSVFFFPPLVVVFLC